MMVEIGRNWLNYDYVTWTDILLAVPVSVTFLAIIFHIYDIWIGPKSHLKNVQLTVHVSMLLRWNAAKQ